MYPLTMEVAAIQSLLELQGSKIFSPLTEMDIADILAAEALLKLRGSGCKCLAQSYENQKNGMLADPNQKPKVNKANQTDITQKSPLLPHRNALAEIQNTSTPVKAESTVEDSSQICNEFLKATKRRTMRRKRTRTSTSESSDSSVEDSPRIYLQTPKARGNNLVRIGEGNAMVPKELLKTIKWDSYRNATRKLLTAVFPRNVLATHSLTGKRSPAFPNKAAKEKLDPYLVDDIVKTVVAKCGVAENIVRITITTKCADESKMLRNRQRQEDEEEDEAIKINFVYEALDPLHQGSDFRMNVPRTLPRYSYCRDKERLRRKETPTRIPVLATLLPRNRCFGYPTSSKKNRKIVVNTVVGKVWHKGKHLEHFAQLAS